FLHLLALMAGAVCAIKIVQELVFSLLLPRLGVRGSRILSDVVTAGASIVAVFALASRAGFNVSGLIATSAVLTAVIGFGLKDTLGNVIGGLSLQTDKSIVIGDWIKVGDVVGRVVDVRWRYTAVETRNWETLIVPNSVLTTEKVMVLGRRRGQPLQWRRWIWFNVDFRTSPAEVTRVVLEALTQAPIPFVAADPPPHCVLMDLHESYARYAARYWLTELAFDDGTDSVVRTRLYFAFKRAGIGFSIPAHAVFLTEESEERKELKDREELERRAEALERVELFRPLTVEDRQQLAGNLHYAPFVGGEVLTRQGAEAHWLYLILKGEVSVHVKADEGLEKEVARLGAGDFFGEMSLMTGARRSATVVAVTPVECYRLDKDAFQRIIRERPAIAEPVAEILARRRTELAAVRENLDQEAQRRHFAAAKSDLLGRIRDFFGLSDEPPRRAAR
ncbi:MAG TPA: cyclic nucleotide-binding domain-containing protein, partial [Vicinamibacteria bacterium]|nr:cyclic nucleotide-binding domain-containing protein [Vicinamibacteria bacterium]